MEIKTKAVQALVYRHGATVIRKGTVHLNKGENRTVIAGLTSGAYTDTMQLRFPKGISANGIHVISREDDEKESAGISEKINEIAQRIEALKAQAQMWLNAGSFSSDRITLTEIEEYISRYPERIAAVNAEIRGLEKEKMKLNREMGEAADRDSRSLISAVLTAPQEGEYPFELVYQETAARWDSKYEIHTDGVSSPLEIRVKAEVFQNTHEDWKDVKIALRTGVPVYSASLPVLNPVYLDYYVPRPAAVFGARGNSMKMAMMSAPVMEESAETDYWASGDTAQLNNVVMNTAQISTTDTMTEYQLGGCFDIASGSDGLNVDLNAFELNADYVIKAVPKEDTRAYLIAEIKTADLPMVIHGKADVYLDGVYTGSAEINPDYGEETYALALGTQERITLTRNAKKKKSSEAFLRNSQSTDYEYEITVTNGKEIPVKLTLSDQIPVPREAAINVEVVRLDKGIRDEKSGEVKWEIELQPQETKTLRVEYRVSWPKDKQLANVSI